VGLLAMGLIAGFVCVKLVPSESGQEPATLGMQTDHAAVQRQLLEALKACDLRTTRCMVGCDEFTKLLAQGDMHHLLFSMGVPVELGPLQLFEILDAGCLGTLSQDDLVDALLRVRSSRGTLPYLMLQRDVLQQQRSEVEQVNSMEWKLKQRLTASVRLTEDVVTADVMELCTELLSWQQKYMHRGGNALLKERPPAGPEPKPQSSCSVISATEPCHFDVVSPELQPPPTPLQPPTLPSRAWVWLGGGEDNSELLYNGERNGDQDIHSNDPHEEAVNSEDASRLQQSRGEKETLHLGHRSPTVQLNHRMGTSNTRASCCSIGSSSSSSPQINGLLQSLCGLQCVTKQPRRPPRTLLPHQRM